MPRLRLLAAALLLGACSAGENPVGPLPPTPEPVVYVSPTIPAIGPVPSPQQLAYQRMETNVFIHFGPNTFTGQEWGDGTADPDVFAPTAFDPDQWLDVFAEVGFEGLTLVAKHHDGFLLWPSAHSDYSVASSAWRDGQGDVVKEVHDATRAAGLAFGVYLSPWDRNSPLWGTYSYNDYFIATLWELTTRDYYEDLGQLYQVWFDYGHDRTLVTEDQLRAYDRPRWINDTRWNQPGAIISPETDSYFAGSEDGVGPEPNWSIRSNVARWAPYECNVTLRGVRSWFWHPQDRPKPLEDVVDIYFTSVGRACTLLFAIGPDQRGLVDDADAARLRQWRAELDAIFATDLAHRATATASASRQGSEGWAPGAAVDGDPDSFWSAPEGATEAWLELDLGRPQTVNVAELAEPIRFGQRVAAFRLEAFVDGAWTEAVRGTTVNYKRLLRFAPVTAQRWRVVVEDARAAPALSTVGLYGAPGWAERWAAAGQLDGPAREPRALPPRDPVGPEGADGRSR